jgi:hypothetical protein
MVFNAILNALKSVLQRDPQRIEERSSTHRRAFFNAILNASKSGLQRDRSTYRRAILNASKVGSHFSFYDCACVVTITVSPARITYEDYFFGQIGAAGRMRSGSSGPLGSPNSDVLTSGNSRVTGVDATERLPRF